MNQRFIQLYADRQSIQPGGLSGPLTFSGMIPSGTYIKSLDKIRFMFSGGVNVALIFATNKLSENPFSALFQNATLYIQDVEVSSINDFKSTTIVQKLMFSSQEDEAQEQSRLTLGLHTATLDALATAAPQVLALYTDHPTFATAGTDNVPAAEVFHISYDSVFGLPTENNSTVSIAGNVKVKIVFQFNPTLNQDFANLATPLIASTSFICEIPVEDKPQMTSGTVDNEYFRFQLWRTVQGNQTIHNQLSATPNVEMVIVYFARSSGVGIDSTQPRVLCRTLVLAENALFVDHSEANQALSSISIRVNGQQYPQVPYTFNSRLISNDYLRAFRDYQTLTNNHKIGELPIINTFEQWQRHPVFAFATKGSASSSQAANISLVLGLAGAPRENQDVVICAISRDQMLATYDEYGACASVEVRAVL